MSSQALMITKTDYEDKKEYWDYQRLLEFNKEALKHKLLKVQGKVFTPMGELSTDDLFDDIWSKISSDELEKPFTGWIPEDVKYRFEWEGDPNSPKQIEPKKGRPVVLRAKQSD